MADAPKVGESFRGVDGRLGFLLFQAQQCFGAAMDRVLGDAGELTRSQFGALSVIVRRPGLSAADLGRAMLVTPQAANLVVGALEAEGLVRKQPSAAHGRILELHATAKGMRAVDAAYPLVIALEDQMADGLSERRLAEVKRWLVDVAVAMTEVTESDG
jgi:DNA-binding MarR family transcriptional regulator